MMRLAFACLLMAPVAMDSLDPRVALAGTTSLRDEVLKEYPLALEKLERFYGHVRIAGRGSHRAGLGKPKLVIEYTVEFLRNDDSIRLVKGVTADSRGPLETRAFVTRPRLSFTAARNAESQQFALQSISPGPSDEARLIGLHARLCFSPFSVGELNLRDSLKSPDFTIKGASRAVHGGRECIKISVERTASGVVVSGSLIVDPHAGWVLREYETAMLSGGRTSRGTVEYEGERDGIPLLRRAKLVYFRDGVPEQTDELTVDRITVEDVPDEEFTLAAFGISDVGATRPPLIPPALAYSVLAGIAALVMVIVWRRMRKARQR